MASARTAADSTRRRSEYLVRIVGGFVTGLKLAGLWAREMASENTVVSGIEEGVVVNDSPPFHPLCRKAPVLFSCMATIADQIVALKVIAVGVNDLNRAKRFYNETLGLPVHVLNGQEVGYLIGGTNLMLKEDWYAKPTDAPNPRVTIEVASAVQFEQGLRERGVVISDPVQIYDGFPVGAFLDSEGNKFWFCSMA